MSVEEAQRNLFGAVLKTNGMILSTDHVRQLFSPLLDRLVLEVRAEMPCYGFGDCDPAVTELCPSCAARVDLAALKAPVV